MNFSEQVINILNDLANKFGIAIDWSAENILPYLQDLGGRIINYEISTSIVWIVISLFLIAVLGVIIYFDIKKFNEVTEYGLSVICAILIGVNLIGIGFQSFDIIKAKTVPETIIMDYVGDYMYLIK